MSRVGILRLRFGPLLADQNFAQDDRSRIAGGMTGER